MDDVRSQEIEHLKKLRAIHTQNRMWLEEQRASHGFASTPIHILNELKRVKEEIVIIDNQLVHLGEIHYVPTGMHLLERIDSLEKEIAELRRYLAVDSSFPPGFSWGEHWFLQFNEEIIVHDKKYHFKDIVNDYGKYHSTDMVALQEVIHQRVVASNDKKFLAILFGDYYSDYFGNEIYTREDFISNRRLVVYAYNKKEPIYESGSKHYVYSGPTFSSDSAHLAFAYAHDWKSSRLRLNADDDMQEQTAIEFQTREEHPNYYEYETVDWKETVALLDLKIYEARSLITTEIEYGYGDSTTPENFFDISFIKANKIIFGISANNRGILSAWNIPINGDEAQMIPNPFFEVNE